MNNILKYLEYFSLLSRKIITIAPFPVTRHNIILILEGNNIYLTSNLKKNEIKNKNDHNKIKIIIMYLLYYYLVRVDVPFDGTMIIEIHNHRHMFYLF